MNRSDGFTLIEAVVVIAIVAILTALAAPSFKSLIQSNAISSNVNSFLSDMRFARSEAIRRGGSVVMCRSNAPESTQACDGTTGATNGWLTGWIVFVDLNKDGAHDAGETVLRVQGPIANLDSIIETNSPTDPYKFKFNATGRLPGPTTTLKFGSGNFPVTAQRVVCVKIGGRVNVAGDGNASCS
jgi:type IV fimbrial biogenesis protein FimT